MAIAPRSDSRPADMVGKALRLLTTLGELPGGATLSELSPRGGLPDEHHVPAFADPVVREHLIDTLELPATGPNTITDRDALRAEIARVQRDGYAVADEEHEAGIRAVGVPVRDPAGAAIAALYVAAPAFRASMEHLVGFVPQLTAAAHELALPLPTGRAR